MKTLLRFALLTFAVAGLAGGAAAQKKVIDGTLQCRDSMRDDRLQNHCEIQEQTLNPGGTINVDGKQNGGVAVKGWDQNKVLVRSRIQTTAPTQAEADWLAKQIIVDTTVCAFMPAARNSATTINGLSATKFSFPLAQTFHC